MRKIVINGRFFIHRVTGVERFAREIVKELDKISKPGEFILVLPPDVGNIPNYQNIKVRHIGKLRNRAWEHISLPYYVSKIKGVSLNLCNVAPIVSPGIVCIHDIKAKVRPADFDKKFRYWYNFLLRNETKRAQKIITVSDFSKHEICKYYNVQSDKVIVIPDGWQHFKKIKFDDNALNKYGLKKYTYFFSMCSLEPNKNFKWIAGEAKKNPNKLFAIAGSINKKIFANGLGFECPPNMKLLGYVSDEEAKSLMKFCAAFLFPTFYEGFGIPPLEAMSAGSREIVVSDTKVMHEIFDASVTFIDPSKPDYNLQEIIKPIKNSEKILNKYSWKKSARKLYKLLKEFE